MAIGLGLRMGLSRSNAIIVYPLDEITTQPAAAYSTRKLSSTYTGSAIRVVRPSDSAEQDIGFASDGKLDMAAMATFLGSQTGNVTTWYDQTGNGLHATQATDSRRPRAPSSRYTNAPLHFTNITTRRMDLPAGLSLDRRNSTIIGVYSVYATTTAHCLFQTGTSTNQASSYTTSQKWSVNPGINSNIRAATNRGVYSLRLSTTALGLKINGDTGTAAALTAATMAGGYIGDTALSGGFEYKGDVEALVFYASALSDADLAEARTAFGLAHGITETETTRVIWDGDSIQVGSSQANGASAGRFAHHQLLPGGMRHFVAAGGGLTLANSITNYTANVDANIAGAANAIVHTNGGTNDIGTTSDDAATIYARLTSYCKLVRGSGAKVVVSTLLPRTGVAGRLVVLGELNTLIRAGWQDIADGLCDYAAHSIMGASGAEFDTTLYSDGLHPTEYGVYLLKDLAAASITGLTSTGTIAFQTTPSTTATSGVALAQQPVVRALDSSGAVDTSFTGNVTVWLTGTGTLSGTTTVAAVAGVATFTNLVITGAGSSNLVFGASTKGGLKSAAITTS